MKPLRLHRVPMIVLAFLLVNVVFIITRVAQDTVVAAASGYNNLASWEANRSVRWLHHLWNPHYPTFGRWFTGLSGIVWIGMFAVAGLIVFRELTGRRHLRWEPILWWSVMAWGCILAGGIACYVYGPYSQFRAYGTCYFDPDTPAHFLYPLALILFACLGLRSVRNRAAGSVASLHPHAPSPSMRR